MTSLFRFVDYWNRASDPVGKVASAEAVAEAAKVSYLRQFVKREDRGIGLSQLGKPLVELVYKQYIQQDEAPIESGLRYIFSVGDYTEAILIALMKDFGCDVHSEQLEIEYKGVRGHIDCMVGDKLVEIKSMSHSYWQNFVSRIDNDRGYITQLSCYARACQSIVPVRAAGWLCLNKSTGQLKWVALHTSVVKPYLLEAARTIKHLERIASECECIADKDVSDYLKKVVQPPDPTPEKKSKVFTGKLLIPESMQYMDSRNWAYPSDDGVYVDRAAWDELWGDTE